MSLHLHVIEEEEAVSAGAAQEQLVDRREANPLHRSLVLGEGGNGGAASRVPELDAGLVGGDGRDALFEGRELHGADGLRVARL